jgi:TolB-like protein/DNA-binding winged helix-turn-helix (wHTH) protein/Tfp pilus assembly protein PilF
MDAKSHEPDAPAVYRVGDLTVDTGAIRVLRGEAEIPLPNLSFELLLALIEAAPSLATTDYLLERAWPGLVVGVETITQRVALLRAALGDDPKQPRYIAVVRGRGYRLTAPVERLEWRAQSIELIDSISGANPDASRSAPSPLSRGGAADKRFVRKAWFWPLLLIAIVGTPLVVSVTASQRARKVIGPAHGAVVPSAGPSSDTRPPMSIAVLPFLDFSESKDEEYLAEGLSEEVINQLTRIPDFRVMARTSSFYYKGKAATVAEIGRALNVAYVLEGSVRKDEQFLRITVQLVRCDDGYHLWSSTYNKTHNDVLQIEDEIASSVTAALYQTIHSSNAHPATVAHAIQGNDERSLGGGTSNANAYDLFLRAMQIYEAPQAGPADYRTAIQEFDQAIRLDPQYALARSRKAAALLRLLIVADEPASRRKLHQQSRTEASRAIDIAPDLGEAHIALALTNEFGEVDLAEAARECSLAAALSPGSAWVQRNCGLTAAEIGHADYATRAFRVALELDPLNPQNDIEFIETLEDARRFDEALRLLQQLRKTDPASVWAASSLAEVLFAVGRSGEIMPLCKDPKVDFDNSDRIGCAVLAHIGMNRQAEAETELRQFAVVGRDKFPFTMACYEALLQHRDAAISMLLVAERKRDPMMVWLKTKWQLDSLRDDPKFKAIEARLHFPEADRYLQ